MEDTGDDSVELEDPREWSSEKVVGFVSFQSVGDQVVQLGVDCMIVCVNSHTTPQIHE